MLRSAVLAGTGPRRKWWQFWKRPDPDALREDLNEVIANIVPNEIPFIYNPDDEPAPLGDVHRRGEAAHRLLNDPTLAEAFRELREDLYAEWMAADPEHRARREQLYYEAHALNRVTAKLIAYRAAARIRAEQSAA